MEQASASPARTNRLTWPWLLPARVLWLACSLASLAIFLTSLPPYAAQIQSTYRGNTQAVLYQNSIGEIALSPEWGSTAARAGVLEGDVLLAVNGIEIASLGQAEALLSGEIGTDVTVRVATGSFPARTLTIQRESEAGSILLAYGLSSQFAVLFMLAGEIFLMALCLGIAAVIFRYRSDDWMALFSALTMTVVLVGLSLPVMVFANAVYQGMYPYWIDTWFALGFSLLILFFYLFPEGRFASRLTAGLAVMLALWMVLGLLNRSLLLWYLPRLLIVSSVLGWIATGVLALGYRYRHSDPVQRQQIRWIVWGAGASAMGLVLQVVPNLFSLNAAQQVVDDFVLSPLGQVLKACLPLSIGLAILRYRLWNIDLILNRVLVYGSLSVLTMLGYLGTTFLLHILFTGLSNPVISFIATGLVAILFEPLRQRLQRAVNRWMYGERDDPYAVLSRLVRTLEGTPSAEEVLPSIAETIGRSLKIPYVAIWLDQEGEERLAASFGVEASDLAPFPLAYQGETIGRLDVARRGPGEEFTEADHRLIENIAHQAGAAAQTVRLNAELIRSRTQIVSEREDERLRIRRDLHDELGPMLASQGLKLAAARQVIRTRPERAETLLEEVMQQSQQTVADIRRLVHGLRPPALDQLGLVEAVRDMARSNGDALPLAISTPPDGLPHLPPAVEVNAYRILLEAWNNATRHAHASLCSVSFTVDKGVLILSIQDNGIGMPKDYRAGVGLRSMRARAQEIGGELAVNTVWPHGTCITARLPFSSHEGQT